MFVQYGSTCRRMAKSGSKGDILAVFDLRNDPWNWSRSCSPPHQSCLAIAITVQPRWLTTHLKQRPNSGHLPNVWGENSKNRTNIILTICKIFWSHLATAGITENCHCTRDPDASCRSHRCCPLKWQRSSWLQWSKRCLRALLQEVRPMDLSSIN